MNTRISSGWLLAAVVAGCGISEAPGPAGPTATSSTGSGSATSGAATGNATGSTAAVTGATTGGAGGATGTGATTGTGGTGAGGAPPAGSLLDRMVTTMVTAPAAVKPGSNNWRIWASTSLGISPVYVAPLANCGTLVCFTTGTAETRTAPATQEARVAVLDASDRLVRMLDIGAFECRGLAAEPDGHFAALLWAPGPADDCADATMNGRVYMKRFDLMGAPDWSTELVNGSASGGDPNCPTDWHIGESRMEFGGGKYAAYYHVHSRSGHEGDTLKLVDLAGAGSTTWSWGCSHSMSNVLRWNPTDMKFMPACVTDCYPGTTGTDFATTSKGGVYINNRNKVIDVAAGCNGSVAGGSLGGAALAPSGWKIVFNAHQAPTTLGQSSYNKTTMNQDIAFATISSGLTMSGAVVWLTNTPAVNEADSSIERWKPSGDDAEQYVVGWTEPGTSYIYRMGRLDPSGKFLEGPLDVTARAKWGRRDDPFRAHTNGDLVWASFDAPSSTSLRLTRIRSGGSCHLRDVLTSSRRARPSGAREPCDKLFGVRSSRRSAWPKRRARRAH